jgi:hypothetical protein
MENQRPKKTYRMVKPLAVKTKLTVLEKAAEKYGNLLCVPVLPLVCQSSMSSYAENVDTMI